MSATSCSEPPQPTRLGPSSTSEEVLEELALDYPLPKAVLEQAEQTTLKSTYTDKLPPMISS
ncbi:hypothetical protein QM150_00100 [Klebsiella pneumoniae]